MNFFSIQIGHTETANILVEKGADIHSENNFGQTALYVAAWNGYTYYYNNYLKKERNFCNSCNQLNPFICKQGTLKL